MEANGGNIRKLIAASGLTVGEFAEKVGYNHSSLFRAIDRNSFAPEKLYEIAAYFGISVQELQKKQDYSTIQAAAIVAARKENLKIEDVTPEEIAYKQLYDQAITRLRELEAKINEVQGKLSIAEGERQIFLDLLQRLGAELPSDHKGG